MNCWQLHLRQYSALRRATMRKEKLPQLNQLTVEWRRAMIQCFQNEISVLTGKQLKPECPNFEEERHWTRMINFLGPPLQQSTRNMESQHGIMKNCSTRTNLLQIERDSLEVVGE